MIVTVTCNAALDRTLHVAALVPGARRALLASHTQAGGKGVNVSRALTLLGHETRAVVLVGGRSGERIVGDLAEAGIPYAAVRAPGESRTCVEIVEPRGERVTQLHGRGVVADGTTVDALSACVLEALAGARWLALCGSLAAGLPEHTYARLIGLARDHGVKVAVDTSGGALGAAWAAGPDLLRVTREEAAGALRVAASDLDAFPAGAPAPVELGVISDGARPIVAWSSAGGRWWIEPPAVHVANPVGCGDAMLAGLLASLEDDADPERALRAAVALSAADAESAVAGRPDPARARGLAARVHVRERHR